MTECPTCGEEVKIICPNCGADIGTKAKMGLGTQSAKKAKRININKINLLKLFLDKKITKPSTIYEISKKLFDDNIKRKRRNNSEKNWNYHDIQADMSMLVGIGLVKFSNDPKVWLSDPDYMEWDIDTKPRYWMSNKDNNIQRIIDAGGWLDGKPLKKEV